MYSQGILNTTTMIAWWSFLRLFMTLIRNVISCVSFRNITGNGHEDKTQENLLYLQDNITITCDNSADLHTYIQHLMSHITIHNFNTAMF